VGGLLECRSSRPTWEANKTKNQQQTHQEGGEINFNNVLFKTIFLQVNVKIVNEILYILLFILIP
jgi:hypothetical protein